MADFGEKTAKSQSLTGPTSDNPLYTTFRNRVVYSVGHSNRSLDEFIERLLAFRIDRLVDVRSKPYSNRFPHFNRESLAWSLAEVDINYDYRGGALGGLGPTVGYEETLREVCELAANERIALCCSEADYRKCHRYLVITPDLLRLGVAVEHISYEK
jgi:uncharacterized protein (DUF488 family)